MASRLIVSALNSRSRDLGSSPGWGHCLTSSPVEGRKTRGPGNEAIIELCYVLGEAGTLIVFLSTQVLRWVKFY